MSGRGGEADGPEHVAAAPSAAGRRPGSGSTTLGNFQQALVRLFVQRAEREPDQVALRYKQFGIWHELTWGEYRSNVERLALGLRRLGVSAGDRVAMMGRPIPEWLFTDLATQSIGGVSFGLYLTTPVEGVKQQLQDSGARVFVAETQEYVDKLFEAEHQAGEHLVDHIVVIDVQGTLGQTSERIVNLSDVQGPVGEGSDRASTEWRHLVEERSADDPVRIFFTAGTTGPPKGAVLSSRNLIEPWAGLFAALEQPPGPGDRSVSYMPMAHIGETVFSVVLPILFGSVPHFPEDEDVVGEALVEVSPTLLLAFPRVLELYASSALIDLETGSGLKRGAYHLATRLRRGRGGADGSRAGRIGAWISYQLLFRHLLNKFGFRQVRLALTGGAPVSADVVGLWDEWGVRIGEFYGSTESGGIATLQTGKAPGAGAAGSAVPGTELRLAGDGEILVRGSGVFAGYVDGRDTGVDAEGWLHTGDVGELLEDGNLRVLDRKDDLFTMASGAVVAPSELEHALKYGPYVRDAMVVGSGRDRLGALLAIDVENVSHWARKENLLFTSMASLTASPEVHELLRRSVDEANDRLAGSGNDLRIGNFRLLPKELEGGDEITPTRTLKRRQLERKFSDLIEEMFADDVTHRAVPGGGAEGGRRPQQHETAETGEGRCGPT